jgi:hypothetical protein
MYNEHSVGTHFCVLCNLQTEETLEYLFLVCPFALDCWHLLQLAVPQGTAKYLGISTGQKASLVPSVCLV